MAKAGVNVRSMPFPNSRVAKSTAYGSKTIKRFPPKPAAAGGGRKSR